MEIVKRWINKRRTNMNIIGKYKAGRLANGFENDKGRIVHGLLDNSYKALCGTKPGKRSVGWLPFTKIYHKKK